MFKCLQNSFVYLKCQQLTLEYCSYYVTDVQPVLFSTPIEIELCVYTIIAFDAVGISSAALSTLYMTTSVHTFTCTYSVRRIPLQSFSLAAATSSAELQVVRYTRVE